MALPFTLSSKKEKKIFRPRSRHRVPLRCTVEKSGVSDVFSQGFVTPSLCIFCLSVLPITNLAEAAHSFLQSRSNSMPFLNISAVTTGLFRTPLRSASSHAVCPCPRLKGCGLCWAMVSKYPDHAQALRKRLVVGFVG